MKVYIAVELKKGYPVPVILGVFKNKKDAETEAYKDPKTWVNIIEKEVK